MSFREASIHIFHDLAGQPLLQAARQQAGCFFFPPAAVARLCQGGRAVLELAPAAFQELAHAAAVLFCTGAGAVEASRAVKTKNDRHPFVTFRRVTLYIRCLKQVGMRLEESVGWKSSWQQSTAFPATSLYL